MKTTITPTGLHVTHGNLSWPLQLSRPLARKIAHETRRIVGRDPKTKRWTLDGHGSIAVSCTRQDPWPRLIFNGGPQVQPTHRELMWFVERLDDYSKGRTR